MRWLTVLAACCAFAQRPNLEDPAVWRGAAQWEEAFLRQALGAGVAKGEAWAAYQGQFVFAVESAAEPRLVINDGAPLPLRRVGALWAWTGSLPTGTSHNFHYLINGKPFGGRTDVPAFGPDSYAKPGVPKGTISEKIVHASRVYPGMQSDYWIYVPAQYDAARPAAVMIWQDGEKYAAHDKPARLLPVLDNLTAQGRIPVMISIFISPGLTEGKRMRSIEYDSVNDTYARFLLEEILPEVANKYRLRTDGYSRAIAGESSGGICSFNAAWFRPQEFARVLSRIGSFTSIQWRPGELDGGNVYPFKIRKEPKRNIRVWLEDGANDLENSHGSWPLQNIQMANSLKMREYDFHFSWGSGTHNTAHGNAELPAALTWLWRDYDPSKTGQAFTMDPAEKDKPYWRVKALNRE